MSVATSAHPPHVRGMANLAPPWARNRAQPKQPDRNRWIVGLRVAGLSFGAIGLEVGVSRETVAGVCWRAGLCKPRPEPLS